MRPDPSIAKRPVTIYALVDPLDLREFYVGKTEQRLSKRLRSHISDARRGNGSNCESIRRILARKRRPEIRMLQTVAVGEDWIEAERSWISRFEGMGLNNRTSGGEGVAGSDRRPPVEQSEASKERRRAAMLAWREEFSRQQRARWQDPDYRKRMTAAQAGKRLTTEHRANVGRASRRSWQDPEVRRRRVDGLHKVKDKPEFREKLSTAVRLCWADPEKRARIVAGHKKRGGNDEV